MQALTAGSIDIALGGGPAFATIVKGVPMKAVAAEANAPNTILLVVLKDGPVQSVDDLKGRTVSVSTAGSLTYWLTQQLSVAQGWGDNGIKIAPLGSSETQIAALRTHQIDGVTTDGVTVYRFMETGDGRVLVKFGDRIKDFHVHVIYASDSLIAGNPEALKAFLAGWFETIAYMRDHRQQTIDIAVKQTGVSQAVAASSYDDTMPILSADGHFSQKALDVLATSFVDTQGATVEARYVEAIDGSLFAEMTIVLSTKRRGARPMQAQRWKVRYAAAFAVAALTGVIAAPRPRPRRRFASARHRPISSPSCRPTSVSKPASSRSMASISISAPLPAMRRWCRD